MELLKDFLVDTGRLAGCFKHTSATYKFYWMLGLLAEVEQGKERVEKQARLSWSAPTIEVAMKGLQ